MIFYDLSLDDLETFLIEKGEKKYRAKQIFEWVYKKKERNFSNMTNLSKSLIELLESNFTLKLLKINTRLVSKDNETTKYVFELSDGNTIESVLMKYSWGTSICVSTQVGCNMGCSFCASGLSKKKRDLTAGEIISQILTVEDNEEIRISNVVIMGIGEPFENYSNTIKAIKLMINHTSLEIAQRKITISTSGLIPGIIDFMNEENQVSLAISLHAPNNELRSKLMPVNKTYDIHKLVSVCKDYVDKTNRRITFEYILLDNVNDSIEHANELSDLLRGLNCYVNIIMYNEVEEFEYKRSSKVRATNFYETLKKRGINSNIRAEKGLDIFAACGQLRQLVDR